ncbi:MAG: alpha/beta fold hydrolase, partial [Bacteroidota bacterium]
KNLTAIYNICRALTAEGFAVMSFDFTGLGESEGDFADTNFSSNVEDLIAAAKFLEENYQAPSLLVGHSLGGAAVLVARASVPSIKAVATIAAPFQPSHVLHLFEDEVEKIDQAGIAKVNIGGRGFHIKKQFLEDVKKISNRAIINNLNAALLVLHSPQDEIVGIENATSIYKAAEHPRSFISLDGANHLLARKQDSYYVGSSIASWAVRYLSLPKEDPLRTDQQAVVRTTEDGYTTEVRVGKHRITADEPEEVGGKDFGPSPYGFLIVALGTCTSMTLRMYADRKQWDLKEIRVHLSHSKQHREDGEHAEENKSKIDVIERTIELEGDLTQEQRKKLLEIADKCPVHKTLHAGVQVNTTLKEAVIP